MKGIVIFSNCTFSRAALHSILIDLYPGAEIKDADASDPLDLIDTDRIIFILNECNLLYYSEFFLKYCKYIPYEKIILLGDERNNLIFNAIACHEYKHIDITLPTKILIDEFSAAISQRKSIYGEKKIKMR
ncbi:hypothetical protein ACQ86O_02475 [Serratia sp. L9]|uniref:hypothetical protein n=1 Tax=Serratia sp. L9 TaxID=3423946 RepID=UPI003D67D69F